MDFKTSPNNSGDISLILQNIFRALLIIRYVLEGSVMGCRTYNYIGPQDCRKVIVVLICEGLGVIINSRLEGSSGSKHVGLAQSRQVGPPGDWRSDSSP